MWRHGLCLRYVPPINTGNAYSQWTPHLTPLIFPLLIMPGLDLNQPIDWDEIEEFEGGVLDLDYDFLWDPGNEGTHGFHFYVSIMFSCASFQV